MVVFLPHYVDTFACISPTWLVQLMYSGPHKAVLVNKAADVVAASPGFQFPTLSFGVGAPRRRARAICLGMQQVAEEQACVVW